MEFWGVEVKAGEPLSVELEEDYCLHLSQAAVGEIKKDKGSQYICLTLKIDDKKLVIGTLSHEKFPQISFDLVLEKPFELAHNYKDGSVYFSGYRVRNPGAGSEDEESDDSEDEQLPLATGNGKPEASKNKPAVATEKPEPKPRVNFVEPVNKPEESDDDDSDDDEEDESSDDLIPSGLAVSNEDEDSDEEEDEDESDEDEDTTPKEAAGPSKKRSVESATKTPVPEKKAKLVTPQKTDGKKPVGHTNVATPYPKGKEAKQAAQKSGGSSFSCKSCSKTFGSQMGLEAHTKAKHSSAA